MFPFRDHRGVHRYSETQVEAVLDLIKSGSKLRGAQDEWLRLSPSERRARRPPVDGRDDVGQNQVRDAQREVAAMVVNLAGRDVIARFPPVLRAFLSQIVNAR